MGVARRKALTMLFSTTHVLLGCCHTLPLALPHAHWDAVIFMTFRLPHSHNVTRAAPLAFTPIGADTFYTTCNCNLSFLHVRSTIHSNSRSSLPLLFHDMHVVLPSSIALCPKKPSNLQWNGGLHFHSHSMKHMWYSRAPSLCAFAEHAVPHDTHAVLPRFVAIRPCTP